MNIITKFLGANYWTTIWGFITVAAGAIVAQPEIIGFLPDSWEPTVRGLALFIAVVAGGVFSVGVKSRNVTGGVIQQTADGSVAAPSSQEKSGSVVDTKQAVPEQKKG